MIKVFLVEDEFNVREKMKRNINWQENDLVLVGEAGDGEMAYPMIQSTKPDIVITDIRMPFMDGLELSRLIKENLPDIKVIILSGYDEFEYAKQAINIGIIDYLLKPISSQQILESIKRVTAIIEKEREQKEAYDSYKLKVNETEKTQRNKFFNDLVTSKLQVSDIIRYSKEMNINISASNYNMLLLKLDIQSEGEKYYYKKNLEIGAQIEKVFMEHSFSLVFNRESEGWAILIKGEEEDLSDLVKRCIQLIDEILKKEEIGYYIGIGAETNRLSHIAYCFDTANKALAYSYVLKDPKVVYYKKIDEKDSIIQFEDNTSIKDIDISTFDKKRIETFLKNGLKVEIDEFVTEYINSIGDGIKSFMIRQYSMMNIYISIISFIKELGYSEEYILENYGDIKRVIKVVGTKEGMEEALREMLNYSLKLRDTVSEDKYATLINDAKEYIEENYNNEIISLNSVAEYVNISPSHFSTIFSQETGQTFVSYLTEIRMKKAKELLRCSNMKTLEVGYAVGYKDPHYFSYIFKKTQNLTPKEYKRANKKK